MRILMFGWEFPPRVSGGLGVACEGLVRGLLETGAEVVLVLPRGPLALSGPGLKPVFARPPQPAGGRGRARRRSAWRLRPYPGGRRRGSRRTPYAAYGPDLVTDVLRYTQAAGSIAREEEFDVIHAHDWLTFEAGLEARRATGRPVVLHVHATEFDRSGENPNAFVFDLERRALAAADRVVAVSRYTARVLAERYGVSPEKIRVVHNAVGPRERFPGLPIGSEDPVVLFAGRITYQKGPEYFVEAAARVAREIPNVRFAVAGAGDRRSDMARRAAEHGIAANFVFTGFLPPGELDRLYAGADVFVLPSVSEPFGLAALEALQHGTPAIVSRGAGVSEVVRNILRVDFGDVDDLASKILSVLLYPPLARTLGREGLAEVKRLSWRDAAEKCLDVYREVQGAGIE